MVLLTKFTLNASSNETPAPSQPATLLVMMLLVTFTSYQLFGVSGKRVTSVPLTASNRMPPPDPASAALPKKRLALITKPGPAPSLNPGTQSTSLVLPHSTPPTVTPSGAAPITTSPPPLVAIVGLVL